MLGSNPSAEAGGRSMGPCKLHGPFSIIHTLAYKAVNPGGLGAGPHLN